MTHQKNKIGKYTIIEKIAEGNYSELYTVADDAVNNFILKLARTKKPRDNELITREYSILSQIKHPNIVTVYDYDKRADGRAYFTLEYIAGKPINEYFAGFSEDFVAVILQILSALGAFHNKGFVHCDLKPENILFNANEKQATLIDFGFAGPPEQESAVAGTLAYMAPEVIKGIAINQRSDLYSLGIIIYEILSGKKFKGSYKSLKDIPEELNTLLSRLVSVEAALRPTIPELYHAFSKYLPSVDVELPVYQVRIPGTGYIEPSGIIEHVCGIEGKAVIVTGNTGLGKTRLLQELRFVLLTKGHRILHFSATEKKSLLDALRKFLKIAKDETTVLEDKFQFFENITQAITKAAQKKKVVIMIDDVDVLSGYEKTLVRYIGYGIRNSNVLLIGTSTSNEAIADFAFDTLPLKPLSETQTNNLLDKTFAEITPTDGKGLDVFAKWLHQQSGGNPLFIVETLKTLFDKEVLYYKNNRWQIRVTKLDALTVPQNLEDLIAPRIQQLPETELYILKTMCLANQPLQTAMVSSTLAGNFDILVENLKNADLIREQEISGNRSLFITNKIIATVVDRRISKHERVTITKDLINAIETYAPEDADYTPLLATLNYNSGNETQAYKYYQIAARNAEAIYDYDSASDYFEILSHYAQKNDTPRYFEFQVKLADIDQIRGNSKTAIDRYTSSLHSNEKKILAAAYAGLGKIHSAVGEYDASIENLQKATYNMSEETESYILTANRLAYVFTNLTRFEEANKVLNKSLELARRIKNYEAEADTLYYLASIEWYKGDFAHGIQQAEKLQKFCRKHSLLKQFAYCTSLLGSLYQQTKNTNMAQKFFNQAIDAFQEIKRFDGLAGALHNSALQLTKQGKVQDAESLFEKSLNIAEKINNKSIYLVAITNLAIISTLLGNYRKAIRQYDNALAIDAAYAWALHGKTMILVEHNNIDNARELRATTTKGKQDIFAEIDQAAVNAAAANVTKSKQFLDNALYILGKHEPDISIRVETLLRASSLYNELGEYDESLKCAKKLLDITNEGSREHIIASALLKIDNFALGKIDAIGICGETARLKEIGCIQDYAFLKRLRVESMTNRGLKQEEVRTAVEELSRAQEVFESIGANLELSKLRRLQSKIFPLIVEDYSRRVISEQYLQTFSGIAELISSNLGDEHFVQNILDLVIKATNAERGALFIKTTKGMDFIAGRDIDQATIKDASEFSKTAIKQLEKGKILFAQDALADPTFNIKKSVMLNQIRSLLCIPLSVSDNVIGAIYLDSRIASGIFGPRDKDFLMTISKILASVIEKSIAFRSMSEENILLKTNIIKEIGSGHLMGKARAMKEVYRLIDSVAGTNSPVLILGETGTGKGMIARLIHLSSQRKNKKFLSINCGTIPETLLESELFGHKKGAFTGAINDKKGLLEEGEGGTVFLDEITNTSLEFQGKLLEAIEEKIIRRVGETTTRNIDVRFLFATNKDLEIEVEDNRFRRDLFYRINVFKIEVPPLRDRANDIPLLAQFFLERYTKEINKQIDGITPEAMQRLREYFWPGNVRELQNVIERAVVLAKSKLINMQDIGFEKTKTAEIIPLKDIKRDAVIEALHMANWNITKAAKLLGIGRRSLHRYIKKFDIASDSTMSIGRKD